jgi:hypothetical protein
VRLLPVPGRHYHPKISLCKENTLKQLSNVFLKYYCAQAKEDGILAGPRRTWEYNSKIHLKEIWDEGVVWIQVAQDRVLLLALVNKVKNLRVPQTRGIYFVS